MTLMEQINNGIKDAMRSRDQVRLDTLRMMKSKILAVDARGALPDAEVVKLFKNYLGNLQEAFDQAKAINRPELVSKLENEIKVVQEFLPKALSEAETKELVKQAIADSGAKNKKELGLVMKSLMKMNAPVDGKLANEIARGLLPD